MSKARRIQKIVVITGPTASGKTTLIETVSARLRKLGFRSAVKVVEPYSGLSFITLHVVVRLLTILNPKYREAAKRRGYVAFLEAVRPRALYKLLPLLTILDDITMIAYTAIIKVALALNACEVVLLEDFVPQAIADHFAYNYLYWEKTRAADLLVREILLFSRLLGNSICVHTQTPEDKRVSWAVRRGDPPTKALGFYNEYVRGVLVRKLLNMLCHNTINIIRGPWRDAAHLSHQKKEFHNSVPSWFDVAKEYVNLFKRC